jgi:adenine-specific DNA methylase
MWNNRKGKTRNRRQFVHDACEGGHRKVGAETRRERDTGQAPPINRLHVWWAHRPLTPSRAAIVASLDSSDTDPETFVR